MVIAFESVIVPKRKNKEITINLKKIHQVYIDSYQNKLQTEWGKKMFANINPEHSKALLQKLSFEDYRAMFSNLKYEMQNDFDVEIEWDNKKS